MLELRLKNIEEVLNRFTWEDGEPKDDHEVYILKSMWVMLCAEFEGSVKNMVESYIDSIKKDKNIEDMHICFLLQNFYGNKEKEEFTIQNIVSLFKREKIDINYTNFTKNKKATYKSYSVEFLFNSLGIFFNEAELITLKLLDGIASTRDSISHWDHQIQITRKELKKNITITIDIFNLLKERIERK